MGLIDSLQQLFGLNRDTREEFADGFAEGGVYYALDDSRDGQMVRVDYQGLLDKDGAAEVYLHYGFDGWREPVRTVMMERREEGGFTAVFPTEEREQLNLCFKDAVGNWDNNNGRNWNLTLV